MLGLSLVAASGGHSSSRCVGLSLSRPLLLRSTGSRRAGSVIVAHGPSCSAACGIFPRPGHEPVSPALAGRLSTTAPPGKPLRDFLHNSGLWSKSNTDFLGDSVSLLRVTQTPSAASALTQSLASLPPLHHIPPRAKSIPLYKALPSDGGVIEEPRGDQT